MSKKQKSPAAPKEKSGAGAVAWLLLALVVIFGGAYVAAHYAAGDKVPRETTVSGVSIGGHPQAKAAQALQAGLADRVNRPIEITVGNKTATVDPAAAGLSVDYEASVAEAGGETSWDPQRLWNYFTGGESLQAEIKVDTEAFNTQLAALQEEYGTPARDGSVAFDGGKIVRTDAVEGRAFDPADTLAALKDAFLEADPAPASLELSRQVPEIDASDVQEAVTSFASPAVAAPVALQFDDSTVKIDPADYTSAITLEPTDGELVPTLKPKKLDKVLSTVVTQGAAVDATVALVDGAPKVIPAKEGVTFDKDQLKAGFLDLVAKPQGQRTMTLDSQVDEPDFTTADAEALQIKEQVSTFPTHYPHADYRNVNLGRAAELIDGTVLKPGETFSLNDTVGERTEANGFTKGYVISDGILIQDLGGGVSQMATTLFNAMFFAGLEDVEHKPHSFYIDRYPVGREATVAWGALDLRFKNDTPYGVLIDAQVTPSTPSSQGTVTVTMYSTKHWDITTTTGDAYNFTKPETRRIDSRTCHPNSGYDGFDIDVKRFFKPVGANTEKRGPETFHTTYTPSDTVICTNPNAVDE